MRSSFDNKLTQLRQRADTIVNKAAKRALLDITYQLDTLKRKSDVSIEPLQDALNSTYLFLKSELSIDDYLRIAKKMQGEPSRLYLGLGIAMMGLCAITVISFIALAYYLPLYMTTASLGMPASLSLAIDISVELIIGAGLGRISLGGYTLFQENNQERHGLSNYMHQFGQAFTNEPPKIAEADSVEDHLRSLAAT